MKWLLTVLALALLGVGAYVLTLDTDVPPISYRVLAVELGLQAVVRIRRQPDGARLIGRRHGCSLGKRVSVLKTSFQE